VAGGEKRHNQKIAGDDAWNMNYENLKALSKCSGKNDDCRKFE
jgi:hypothetical protein